jgi:hypothetical protein
MLVIFPGKEFDSPGGILRKGGLARGKLRHFVATMGTTLPTGGWSILSISPANRRRIVVGMPIMDALDAFDDGASESEAVPKAPQPQSSQ